MCCTRGCGMPCSTFTNRSPSRSGCRSLSTTSADSQLPIVVAGLAFWLGFRPKRSHRKSIGRRSSRTSRLTLPQVAREEVLDVAGNELVITGSCQAALMFGTLSPTVTSRDAMLLAERLVSLSTEAGNGPALIPLVRTVPIRSLGGPAWPQGYELAKDLWESLGHRQRTALGWILKRFTRGWL